jgi:chromosome segregation ATPase
LGVSASLKEEHRLREQAEFALQEIRKALFSEQKEKQKVEESRASAEADLVCEREDTIKLRNTKAALEKELKSERKKRRKVEEEKAKLEEELGRLRGAANREVEKRKEMSSVEIEELNRQLAHIKLKLANKREKVKATTRDLALMAQREKERLVDEDASYYATPDFNKLKMDELLRLEEHYLSSLRVVGVAKVSLLHTQHWLPHPARSHATVLTLFVCSKNNFNSKWRSCSEPRQCWRSRRSAPSAPIVR